ncbi:MAG: DUF4097 family beta strand repeat-containing protein [Calditrichaceae bacterium]
MRKLIIILLAIPVIAGSLAGASLEREFKIPMGKKISVDISTGGSVSILGWDKEKVSVKVEYRGREVDENMVQFETTRSGLNISVRSDNDYHGGLHFFIQAPKKSDIEIETMGGDIELENLEGHFSGQTMGGELDLRKLKGKVELTTFGGEITLKDSDIDGELKTMGGRVFFENVTGNIKGTSLGGNVTYKNVVNRTGDYKAKGDEVYISTMGGGINVDEAPMGANVKTMGGDIHIRQAKAYVQAKTMGGEIVIDGIDGWVKATTMGGDVTVVMTGNPDKGDRHVELSSMGGDIELTLPEEISADFDIKLTYTKNSRKNYKIRSDFDLKIEESSEWEYSHGSPRKYIKGTGAVKGGKNSVSVSTINGEIRVIKGN